MTNGINPNQLAPDERLAEVADILALGLMRLQSCKSSGISADTGESSLHFTPDQSGAADRNSPEVVS